MKKTMIVFVILSAISKIIAFCREVALTYFWGAGDVSDVFLLSMIVPVVVFGFIAGGVTAGYIPIYQRLKNEKGDYLASKFTNNVINTLFVICIFFICIYFFSADKILRLFASGLCDGKIELAKEFTCFSIWTIIITAFITILSGFLQINGKVLVTSIISVPLNFGIICSIVIASITRNIYFLPLGFLMSTVLQGLFVLSVSLKNGFVYFLSIDWNDAYLKKFLSSLSILIFSSSLVQINLLIDRSLATWTVVGGLSLLEYGNRINDFIMGVAIIPISAVLFPQMIKVRGDCVKLTNTLRDGVRLSLLIVVPASVVIVFFSETIVKIIYYRGAFTLEDVLYTSEIVRFYGMGLLCFSLRELMVKCFYAIDDMKSPMINSFVGIVINSILSFILLNVMGLGGLALATTVSGVISVILLYRSLKKRLIMIEVRYGVLKCIMLYALSGLMCYFALVLCGIVDLIINETLISFLISMLCFWGAYLMIMLLIGGINTSEIKHVMRI